VALRGSISAPVRVTDLVEASKDMASLYIAFISYIHNSAFKDEFLCVLDALSRTCGDVFQAIDTFFRANDVKWELLCGLCTDGAPAMLGHSSGLHTYVKKVSPDCMFMHCMMHREVLASKTLGPELMKGA